MEPLDGRRSALSRLPQYLMNAMFGWARAVCVDISLPFWQCTINNRFIIVPMQRLAFHSASPQIPNAGAHGMFALSAITGKIEIPRIIV
jgi:hypothetical protein